jgi:3-oxoacyl-[acyl-carrier protein] reductase
VYSLKVAAYADRQSAVQKCERCRHEVNTRQKGMVTRAAAGIGRAIALELAKEGAALYLLDIDKAKLDATAQEARSYGVEVVTAICDLSDSAQINQAVSSLRAAWGRLDILVNNAGIAYCGATHLMTDEQWRRIISVNLVAPIQLVHMLLPTLLSAGDGHILNVCSIFGLAPWRKTAAYQTTKYGLVGLTAALRAEYSHANLGVTALCPGFVQTALLEEGATAYPSVRVHLPPWICTTPEHVARKALDAIRQNQATAVVTPFAHAYWRLARLSPGLADWLVRQYWKRRAKLARLNHERQVILPTK